MSVLRKRINIRIPVTQGFLVDNDDLITHACHIYSNEVYLVIDEYPFYTYGSTYKKWNGTLQPVIEVPIECDGGTSYYEYVRLVPDDYIICHSDNKLTTLHDNEWQKRIELISKWEADRLKIEFIDPVFRKLRAASLDYEFYMNYMINLEEKNE